jgi:glycosyltransferase involved in cell wall biosynthesis
MRVAVDGRTLEKERRGIARVTAGMLEALRATFPSEDWRVVTAGSGAGRRARYAAAALAGRPRLDRLAGAPPDVVWLPEPAPVAVSHGVPFVLTLHDLSFDARPQDFTGYERLWQRLARPQSLARRAAMVMTNSTATREEALSRWGLPAEKVVAVLPGVGRVGEAAGRGVPATLGVPSRYLLFVGALEPRKAPEVLAAAFRAARAEGLDAGLVVVGDGRERDVLAAAGATLLGRVSDDVLAGLYAGAIALVLPSRLEGLGLPPLEALSFGTPSVVSDVPGMRETLGEGALFVAPGDVAALAQALRRIDEDDALRGRLAAAGAPRVAALSWERAARQAHEVLITAAR